MRKGTQGCTEMMDQGVFKNKIGPESEKIKQFIQAIFQENKLKITIQGNLKFVDYLDVLDYLDYLD